MSGVFNDASFSTSMRNSTTSSWESSVSAAGSGEERKSSHPGSRSGELTIRYQAGVMSREIRNTVTRSTRR